MTKKLDKIFKNSKRLKIDDNTKIVIMSDCHRGCGNNFDNFIKNQNIYKTAMFYYYNNDFTYIELGDGDEMWEVNNYEDIIEMHLDVFKLLKKFHTLNRLIMLYGNHDISKRSPIILQKYFFKYYDKNMKKYEVLLEGLTVDESLILNYKGYDMFLIHGHQVSILDSTFIYLSKFLVRNIWRPLEFIGIKAPISVAKNNRVSKRIEKKLQNWSIRNKKILISGHTHKSIFPKTGESLYFNDGCCIYPNVITCIEIEKGKITLVKWEPEVNENRLISIERKILDGNESIINFYEINVDKNIK